MTVRNGTRDDGTGGGRVAVLVFPGTNSEDETLRAVRAVGLDGALVHWSRPESLADFDAFVLPGGFAHEDRIRAGAVAAHDALMDPVIEAAQAGKFVLGICNGAQILAEAGLVPGTGPLRRPTAAFAPNESGRFMSVHVHVKLAVAPERVPILAGIEPGALIPAWASHGDGRLVAPPDELARMQAGGNIAFVYADRDGNPAAAPNGAALSAAALVNQAGNVLAIMPHPERDAWNYQHLDASRERARMLAPSGGIHFFEHFARAVRGAATAGREAHA
jgi:phosphoribosylformylglycinamidine synthase